MKKTFFLMILLSTGAPSFCQFDYLFLPGQVDSVACRIVEVKQDYISYIRYGEKIVESKGTKEIRKIKLFRSPPTEGVYNTRDLLDIFEYERMSEVIWLGLDFSFVKICRKSSNESFSSDLFHSMNDFIIEKAKKDFLVFFGSYSQLPLSGISKINLQPVSAANNLVNMQSVFNCDDDPFLPLDYIRKSVKNYVFESLNSGIAMVFFYNSINKKKEKIYVTLVFFDIKTRDVLLTFSDQLPAGGIGPAWHWTSGLPEMVNNMKRTGFQYNMMYRIYK